MPTAILFRRMITFICLFPGKPLPAEERSSSLVMSSFVSIAMLLLKMVLQFPGVGLHDVTIIKNVSGHHNRRAEYLRYQQMGKERRLIIAEGNKVFRGYGYCRRPFTGLAKQRNFFIPDTGGTFLLMIVFGHLLFEKAGPFTNRDQVETVNTKCSGNIIPVQVKSGYYPAVTRAL
jgi:hypothetical protein